VCRLTVLCGTRGGGLNDKEARRPSLRIALSTSSGPMRPSEGGS
jgi:hypothetical protein